MNDLATMHEQIALTLEFIDNMELKKAFGDFLDRKRAESVETADALGVMASQKLLHEVQKMDPFGYQGA